MATLDVPILSRMLRPLAANLREELLRAVAEMSSSPKEEERYHELADKNSEGTITPTERQELESMVSANAVLSALRREARETLARRGV
jgi:hypothetical protein